MPFPYHFKEEEYDIFDKACYHIIPEIGTHKPDE